MIVWTLLAGGMLENLDPLVSAPGHRRDWHEPGDRTRFSIGVMAEAAKPRTLSVAAAEGGDLWAGCARTTPCLSYATFWKRKKCGASPTTASCALQPRQSWQDRSPLWQPDHAEKADWSRGSWPSAALDAAPACPWYTAAATNASCCAGHCLPPSGSSWGKSSIVIRELSLGGGMERRRQPARGLRSEHRDASGVRRVRGQVLLRRAR